MKVNVIQATEASFRSRFHRWSNWIDIAVFDHIRCGQLLQMSVTRGNAKRFRTRAFKSLGSFPECSIREAGDLTPMKSTDH